MRVSMRWAAAVLATASAAGAAFGAQRDTIMTPQGAAVTVAEHRGRAMADSPEPASWSLQYTIHGSGTVTGIIAPTEDAAADSSPALALEPSTGRVIAIWSRFDGAARKLAYARLEPAGWTDFHFLTFGRGDDYEARVGTGAGGSYLFWIAAGPRYLYAPIDLRAGRLLAVPRALDLGHLVPGVPTDLTIDGASDGPILGKGGGKSGGKDGSATSTTEPLALTQDRCIQGTNDGPVTGTGNGGNKKAAVGWGVGSRGDCRGQVVLVPDASGTTLIALRFVDGATEVIRQVPVPAPLPEHFLETTLDGNIGSACY